jgi:hypothetical protein
LTPEGKVKDGIKKWLRAEGLVAASEVPKRIDEDFDGWYYMPVQSRFSVKGIGDFVGVWRGVPWSIEAKAPRGQPTDNQLQQMAAFRKAGGVSHVVSDVSQLAAFKREMEARWTNATSNSLPSRSSVPANGQSVQPRREPAKRLSPGSMGRRVWTAATRYPSRA